MSLLCDTKAITCVTPGEIDPSELSELYCKMVQHQIGQISKAIFSQV